MKKLILMLAFVAGPILYAQQKPSSVSLKNDEVLKTEQTKTAQATKSTQSTQAKAFNLSDTEAVNRKSKAKTTDSKTTTVKKLRNAESLKDKIEK